MQPKNIVHTSSPCLAKVKLLPKQRRQTPGTPGLSAPFLGHEFHGYSWVPPGTTGGTSWSQKMVPQIRLRGLRAPHGTSISCGDPKCPTSRKLRSTAHSVAGQELKMKLDQTFFWIGTIVLTIKFDMMIVAIIMNTNTHVVVRCQTIIHYRVRNKLDASDRDHVFVLWVIWMCLKFSWICTALENLQVIHETKMIEIARFWSAFHDQMLHSRNKSWANGPPRNPHRAGSKLLFPK